MEGNSNDNNNKAFVLYNKYVRKYKRDYGVKYASISTNLSKIGKSLFKDKFIGVFPVDKIPVMKNDSYFIFNTDKHGSKGTHWLACYFKNNIYYIYDSFARSSRKIVPHFVNQIKKSKMKYVDSDKFDKEQSVTELNCSIRALAWLSVVRDLSIKSALKI